MTRFEMFYALGIFEKYEKEYGRKPTQEELRKEMVKIMLGKNR